MRDLGINVKHNVRKKKRDKEKKVKSVASK